METALDCKFCEPSGLTKDTGQHLYVNIRKKVYFCHRCGAKGKWEAQFPSALLAPTKREAKYNKYENVELFHFKIKGDHPVANLVYDYICKRLPVDIVMDKVRWCPDIKRAIFPLWVDGKVMMWQGRTIYKKVKPKYLIMGPCSQYLYGFDEAEDWAVLVEGPIDALSCCNGVALFGKSISDRQFQMLSSKFKKIYWCLDGDTIGEKRIEKQKKKLKEFVEVIDLKLPKHKDANDLGMEAMNELLRVSGHIG